jgi:hypothetical protein
MSIKTQKPKTTNNIIIKVSIKIRWVVINIFITWTIFIMMGTH